MKAKFYQVGGCVRDEILNIPSKDVDYSVECMSFNHMRESILGRNGEIFLETPEYFTIRAKVPGLGACDFVMCRKDGDYSDGRRPDKVIHGTLLDDLKRRDFTMNAIAKCEQGNLIDPFNGKNDIERGEICPVGNAKDRFCEDSLRMIRAIRFSITKNMNMNPEIVQCLFNSELIAKLKNVSGERIREELRKCFKFNTMKTLEMLRDFPELSNAIFECGLWLEPTFKS
jgi:tRNA nucleotidyltransferase (CCA-adding enzyme)